MLRGWGVEEVMQEKRKGEIWRAVFSLVPGIERTCLIGLSEEAI